MKNSYLEEMHKLDHDDEMRYRLLMRGIKLLLEERKRRHPKLIQLFDVPKRKKDLQAGKWL